MSLRNALLLSGLCLALWQCDTGNGPIPAEVATSGGRPGDSFADFTLEGRGLGSFEGRAVAARLAGPEAGYRIAHGRTRIVGASFRIEFTGAREVDLYKPFALYLDLDGNGECTPGRDQGLIGGTGGAAPPQVRIVEEGDIAPMDAYGCDFIAARRFLPFASE